jgi:hypothetical protein
LFLAAFWFEIPFVVGWYLYLFMVADLLHTIWAFSVVKRRLFPEQRYDVRVRRATIEDLPRLMKIDRAAFPDPGQQVSSEELSRRLETGTTNLVLEHWRIGVIGVLYGRLIKLAEVEFMPEVRWSDLANKGDFTPVAGADMLYVVGIAALSKKHRVSDRLEAAAIRKTIELKLPFGGGGPRIPGFATSGYSLDQLDRYVLAKGKDGLPIDPLLRLFVKNSMLPILGPLVRPVRGIKNYFPDAESMGCAALVVFSDPLRQTRIGAMLLDRSSLVRKVWGWLLEKAMLL